MSENKKSFLDIIKAAQELKNKETKDHPDTSSSPDGKVKKSSKPKVFGNKPMKKVTGRGR